MKFTWPSVERTALRLTQAGVVMAALASVAALGYSLHGQRAHRVVAEAPAATAGDAKLITQKIPDSEVTFDLVPIPGGDFMMGSPATEKKRRPDEGPQFKVEVDPFYMGKCEVTWDEYAEYLRNYDRLAKARPPAIPADKFADAVSYPTPMYELEAGPELDRMGRPGKFPAVIMSQYSARQYTKWLSKKTGRFFRLPTEAEWEYACRAGTTTAYSFADDSKKIDDFGWDFDNSELKGGDPAYRKVGSRKANPWGLFDMHGNVAEWVIDAYDKDWYKKFEGKTVNWKDVINWPTQQYGRVIRGGGYSSEADDLRSAARLFSKKGMNVRDPQIPQSPYWLTEGFWIGFRVVAPIKEPTEQEKAKFWDVDDENTKSTSNRDRDIKELLSAPSAAGASK